MWSKLKLGAVSAAAEKGATFVGLGVIDSVLNYLGLGLRALLRAFDVSQAPSG